MNNPLAVRGFVTLTSKDLLENEPNEFSIGGFRVDGVTFDWNEASLIKSYDATGRLVLDWQLRDFDAEFFTDSNNGATTIDWDKVLTGKIEDISFEAEFIDPNGGEDESPAFDVTGFAIGDFQNDNTLTIYDFTNDQLDAYNTEQNI